MEDEEKRHQEIIDKGLTLEEKKIIPRLIMKWQIENDVLSLLKLAIILQRFPRDSDKKFAKTISKLNDCIEFINIEKKKIELYSKVNNEENFKKLESAEFRLIKSEKYIFDFYGRVFNSCNFILEKIGYKGEDFEDGYSM